MTEMNFGHDLFFMGKVVNRKDSEQSRPHAGSRLWSS